jgi:hypothetical protein
MHVIENPEEFRQKISKKLEKILNDEIKIAENLEKGIYNFCIKEAGERNIVKKFRQGDKSARDCVYDTSRDGSGKMAAINGR